MKHIVSVLALVALSGCALMNNGPDEGLPEIPSHPSAEWVRENLPAFQRAAEEHPTQGNLEAVERLQQFADQQGRSAAKVSQVNKELTLAWSNYGRGGAAIRQPAYIHVLGESFNQSQQASSPDLSSTESRLTQEQLDEALKSIEGMQHAQKSDTAGRGYSVYEMARWERYCDGGKSMDEPDWQFVTQQGGLSGIPETLEPNCTLPEHDYQKYLAAWTHFCEAETPTQDEWKIIRNSTRPKTVVNPCKALQ